MTTMDIPRRHLVEETPEGTRWFYPAPAGSGQHYGGPRTIGWETEDGASLNRLPVALSIEHKPGWLMSDKPLTAVVQVLQEPDVLVGHRRKLVTELAGDDEVAAALINAHGGELSRSFPRQFSPDDLDARPTAEECGCSDMQVCTWHEVFNRAYVKVMVSPEPTRVRHELPDSVPLTGGLDWAPERRWHVADAVAAYYGGTVAHVLPGYLVPDVKAVGARVEEKLEELGLKGWAVYAFDRERTVSCSGEIPWDQPRPWTKAKGRGKETRTENFHRERRSQMAMAYRQELTVPRALQANTKQEALNLEAELIERLAEVLVPSHTVACSSCSGTGYAD